MTVTKQALKQNKLKLSISVPEEEYKSILVKKATEIGKTLSIPGFRTGKAPYDVLKKHIGEMNLLSEVIEEVVHNTYSDAVEQEKLKVALSPKLEVTKMAPNNAIEYIAEVVLIPSVQLADFARIKVTEKDIRVDEKEVTELFEHLAKTRSKEELKSGPAAMGDRVEFDVETYLFDQKDAIEQARAESMIVGEVYMVEGLSEKLLGMKKDETKEFSLKFPETYSKVVYAGKNVHIKITVRSVWQISLPQVDDAFAQGINKKFKTIQELKDQIKKNIEYGKKDQERTRKEREILEEMVSKSIFGEIADELIHDTKKHLIEEMKYIIEQQGTLWEDYLKQIEKNEQDLLKEFFEPAQMRIKIDAIIAHIVEDQSLEAEDHEVEEEAKKFLSQYASVGQAKKEVDIPYLVTKIYKHLLSRKAIEWLTKQVENKKKE